MKRCPQCGQTFEDNVQFCPADGAKPVLMGAGGEADPYVGVVLGGKYRLEKKVGEGGMGKIYLSRHITLNKRYAVKMLNPEYSNNQEAIERFRREAVTAGELEHPNIINVTDIDYTQEGQAYIVMEYLDGRELREEMKKTPVIQPQRIMRILYQVARALDAAHAKGIIHRDLKPENIFLIDRADQKDVVKILDFGISKIKGARAANLTQTGMVIGTPHYMAPEQARGDRDIDHRVDIFALGCIAYEMFTGQLPVNGDSPTAILMKILLEEPPPPETINPSINPGISAAIRRAMSKDTSSRFQSCMEFVESLRAASQMQGEAFTTSAYMAAPVIPPSAQAQFRPPSQQQAGFRPPSQPQQAGYRQMSQAQPQVQQPVPVISQQQYPPQSGQQAMTGTGVTPMTWTGTGGMAPAGVYPPPRKKSSAALIVIPIVLLFLIGGAVGGYFIYASLTKQISTTGGNLTIGTNAAGQGDQTTTGGDTKGTGTTKTTGDEGATKATPADEKATIKFRTDPEGAMVTQKIGAVERELCKTECEYEFGSSKKKLMIIFTKGGYHDEEIEIAPDVAYKEIIVPLTEKTKKKKAGTKVKVVDTSTDKPIVPTTGTGGKKVPIIKLIDSPDSKDTKTKKKPIIRVIPGQ